MYKPVRWLLGFSVLRIDGASPSMCLNRFASEKLIFWDLQSADEFSMQVTIPIRDISRAQTLAEAAQCSASVVRKDGLVPRYGSLFRRWPFLLTLLAVAFFSLWFSGRVWFFSVEGNAIVPDERILRAVASCGVKAGTRGKIITPQNIKDRVLAQIPELSWLTVRQSGCFAVISVREKEKPLPQENRREFCNITAARGGQIDEITVLDGSAQCKPGDTVAEGDILISAYVDLENTIRVTSAIGEVFARTWREETVCTPVQYSQKQYTGEERRVFYLRFGKNMIKLSRDSGISGATCDKITKTTVLTLPGGFQLPISLIRETIRSYTPVAASVLETEAESMLSAFATERVTRSMIAGEILKTDLSCAGNSSVYVLRGQFECREMIGRRVRAELFKED